MVILEAMAMQKAVVATNAGGNPELITSGETGLLIDRTPKDLSEALTQLIHDKPQREAFGVAGCNVAVQRFTVLAMAQNVSNLYGSMLGSR